MKAVEEGGGRGAGWGLGEKNKTYHLPRAPAEQGQVGCHLNNVISSA